MISINFLIWMMKPNTWIVCRIGSIRRMDRNGRGTFQPLYCTIIHFILKGEVKISRVISDNGKILSSDLKHFWVKNSNSGAFQIKPDLNYFVSLQMRISSTLVVDSMQLMQWLMLYRASVSTCTSYNVYNLYISWEHCTVSNKSIRSCNHLLA